MNYSEHSRGGARNFPTEGLELPTGELEGLKYGVSVRYLAKVLQTRAKSSSSVGLDVSDGQL